MPGSGEKDKKCCNAARDMIYCYKYKYARMRSA